MMGSSASQPIGWAQFHHVGPISSPFNIVAGAASLRLCFFLRLSFKALISPVGQKLCHLCHVPTLRDIWCEKAPKLKGILEISSEFFDSRPSLCLAFFNGEEMGKGRGSWGGSSSETSKRNSFNGRKWTNFLLIINVLVFATQFATHGKLLLWGAKVNRLIDKGQFWRLITSSFLHANIGHLMVNSYSLNSIGPTIESLCGPKRFLAVYFISAVASSATSYWFCKAPAVGASGAIFGLVGSFAVFVIRHRGMLGGGKEELQHIAQVILLNMVMGMMTKGIDNWGHLGGLLGGVATSWFVGPAWKYKSLAIDGRKIFVDRAPIHYLANRNDKL